MAKLIFLLDGNVIQDYPLDKERMTIGRRAANDIHIDNLAISGEHAVITRDGEDVFIEDLNSTNGTLVNQARIKKHALKHGDEIVLGKYSLKFINDGLASHIPANGFEDTVTVESKTDATGEEAEPQHEEALTEEVNGTEDAESEAPDQEEVVVAEAAESSAVNDEEEAPQLNPRLQILNGNNAGNALSLDKSMVKIGQPGEQVAVVTKRQDGYFLTHVAGDNFPLINGKAIGAQAYALNNHDVIEVLGDKMEFRLD